MLVANVKDYTKGWMVGEFRPAAYRTDGWEFAHHYHEKGFVGTDHMHRSSTEMNYIVFGVVRVKGKTLGRGDMFIFTPGEWCGKVEFLEDTDLIVLRNKGGNDKEERDANRELEGRGKKAAGKS